MIKWVGFGKSLKQFFIISLISCFILLGSSFVSAGFVFKFNTTYAGPFDSNYDINVFGKGIPLTSSLGYSKKMLYITNGRYMFYQQNQLPYVYSNGIYGQINFYKVCPSLGGSGNPFGTSSCSSYPCSVNYGQNNCTQTNISNPEETKNIIGNFFNTLNQSTDYYYIHYVNNLTMFCFYSSSLDKIMCFFQPSSSNGTNYGAGFDGISSNLLFNPPSYSPTGDTSGGGSSFNVYTGSRLRGILGIEKDYTNLDMVHGYECVGLFSDLCYGGFDIDDIFDPSESFEDFAGYKAGQGATIFQLYSRYSGFNSMTQFLQTILTRYQNNQINQFKTEPKALLMVGSQLNVAGFKPSYVAEYCDLLLNSDYREVYTGNSVDSLRAKHCLNNQSNRNILKNSSGQDITMQTSNVGIFGSGEDIDFDPANFFSNIMHQIDTKLSDPTKGGAVGILPGYIVAVFLGIIFIRLISH